MEAAILQELNQSLGLSIQPGTDEAGLHQVLTHWVNELINHDFDKLVQLLYRIDVDEKKLRYLLQQAKGEGAAPMIAQLIIDRQKQKAAYRQQQKPPDDISDEERW